MTASFAAGRCSVCFVHGSADDAAHVETRQHQIMAAPAESRRARKREAAAFMWVHENPSSDADHKARRRTSVSFTDECRSCGGRIRKVTR